MKKRILAVMLLAFCLVGSLVIPASAYYTGSDGFAESWVDDEEDEYSFKHEINGGYIMIAKKNGPAGYFSINPFKKGDIVSVSPDVSGDVVIPEKIQGIQITGIWEYAYPSFFISYHNFTYLEEMTSLTLPGTIKTVHLYLGEFTPKLKRIVIGEGTENITQLLQFGYGVSDIVIPPSVTQIDDEAMMEDSYIKYDEDGNPLLDENGNYIYEITPYDNLTIHGKTGSYAEEYANKMGYKFNSTRVVTPFTDVIGHWAELDLEWAYTNKLFGGVSADKFAPDTQMDRGMLVTVLYRYAGEPTVTGDTKFTDLEDGAYYKDAVLWAEQNGIVDGVSADKFAPESQVTREQFAAILSRYADKNDITGTVGEISGFADASKVSPWAVDAVKWSIGSKIINGKGNNEIMPQGNATRAEIATMMQRFSALGKAGE